MLGIVAGIVVAAVGMFLTFWLGFAWLSYTLDKPTMYNSRLWGSFWIAVYFISAFALIGLVFLSVVAGVLLGAYING